MSHFAEIKNGIVERVIVIDNEKLIDSSGNENEQLGIEFCKSLFGQDTEWKQTSYNTINGSHLAGGNPLRGTFASPGFIYDSNADKFYPPSNHNGWIYDFDLSEWIPPSPMPTSPGLWYWDEEEMVWAK